MGALEQLQTNRQARALSLSKGFNNNDIEKAHQVGDIHPNGKWVWTQLPNGKYDWRAVKKTSNSGSQAQPKKEEGKGKQIPSELKGFTRHEDAKNLGYWYEKDVNGYNVKIITLVDRTAGGYESVAYKIEVNGEGIPKDLPIYGISPDKTFAATDEIEDWYDTIDIYKKIEQVLEKKPKTTTKKQIPDFTPKVPADIAKLTSRSTERDAYTKFGGHLLIEKYGSIADWKKDFEKNNPGSKVYDANEWQRQLEIDSREEARAMLQRKFGSSLATGRVSKTDQISAMKDYFVGKAKAEELKWRSDENKRYWDTVGAGRKVQIEKRKKELKELFDKNQSEATKAVTNLFSGISDINVSVKLSSSGQRVEISLPNSKTDDITFYRRDDYNDGFEEEVSLYSQRFSLSSADDMKAMVAQGKVLSVLSENKDKIVKVLEKADEMRKKIQSEYSDLADELNADYSEKDF